MKSLLVLSIILFFSSKAFSYPENKMDDCIASALSYPATMSISKDLIKDYCDCALTAIIDEKKEIQASGYDCAQKHFN